MNNLTTVRVTREVLTSGSRSSVVSGNGLELRFSGSFIMSQCFVPRDLYYINVIKFDCGFVSSV